ncbi:MAG: hypothetical protein D6816_02035 [Bacteroidetes bacterium]|nr:MAG: hypothetical protein D6816_02035 [Bacteroidota bacterium]
MKVVTEDNEYLKSLEQRKTYTDSFEQAINSPFGEVLLQAIDNLEKDALERLTKVWRKSSLAQARADVKAARYIKSVLQSMLAEKKSLENEIKSYNDMEEHIYED